MARRDPHRHRCRRYQYRCCTDRQATGGGAVKTPTTVDVTGAAHGAAELLDETGRGNEVAAVMIGTTHFVNAVVQRCGLNRAAALRICLPSSASLRPMVDWPEDLAAVVDDGTYLVAGGHEYDGRLLAPLDEHAIAARGMRAADVTAAAVTAVFSPLTDELEARAAAIMRQNTQTSASPCRARSAGLGFWSARTSPCSMPHSPTWRQRPSPPSKKRSQTVGSRRPSS